MPNLKNIIRCSFLYLLTGFFTLSFAYPHATWNSQFAEYIEISSSKTDVIRARRLELLLGKTEGPVQQKLDAVNKFFNKVRWASDSSSWGKKDYWQTPLETLVKFKGDCEDVAIVKYAALRVMGIPDENLALVYAMKKGRPHMVLAYYDSKDADPTILDNDINSTSKASHRKDLRPVYVFNSKTLWLTDPYMNKLGKGRSAPPSHRLSLI